MVIETNNKSRLVVEDYESDNEKGLFFAVRNKKNVIEDCLYVPEGEVVAIYNFIHAIYEESLTVDEYVVYSQLFNEIGNLAKRLHELGEY